MVFISSDGCVAPEIVSMNTSIVKVAIPSGDEVPQVFDLEALRFSMAIVHLNSAIWYGIHSGGIVYVNVACFHNRNEVQRAHLGSK